MPNIQQTGIPGLRYSFKESTQFTYPSSETRTKIALHRIIVRFWPKRLGRPALMVNLAKVLHTEFEQRGAISDLEEALVVARSALELCPQGHRHRTLILGDIAYYLHTRFHQLGTLSDLEEALALGRNTLELRPQGHPHRSLSLGNLASHHLSRFKHAF